LAHMSKPSARGAIICTYNVSYNEIISLSHIIVSIQ
jgi:hypothetical protein